ncbi:MAG: hypothetical protein RL199_1130 [Pseudomonadota bacterium]|jgi:SAM-dependent methyltransferase
MERSGGSNGRLSPVVAVFEQALAEHGATPQGANWRDGPSQRARFSQFEPLWDRLDSFSLNDVGCGYGALVDHLDERPSRRIDYLGLDVAPAMVAAAQSRFAGRGDVRFLVAEAPPRVADFSVASGIFNRRDGFDDASWLAIVHETLDRVHETSRQGFGFNCLTSYSDADRMRPDLFYADPCALFDWCKRRYSPHVTVVHDYGLYDFTILVRSAPRS